MKAYWAIVKGEFMIAAMYRASFIFTVLSNLLYIALVYYLWSSIYRGATVIRGMTFEQTFVYLALGSSIFILFKTYSDWIISHRILEGSITVDLFKPLDFQLQMLSHAAGSALSNLVLITAPALIVVGLTVGGRVPIGLGWLCFMPAVIIAFTISFLLDYMVGLTSFYTSSLWGISMTKEIVVTLLSGALIPIQFFPEAVQGILKVLPFQTIYNVPLTMITQPDRPVSEFVAQLSVQVAWLIVLWVASRLFFRRAVRVLTVAGG
ncbi:hypothetical protein TFLX_00514 [Thermoflexales bacterium]|nr:hypothetical protein TFLX_00514 [Thermoflexales bacterium]